MAELSLLSRCPTCGQNRAVAAVCVCGCPVWRHKIDPHRKIRTVCWHADCGCRQYVEAVADAQ